MSKVKVTMTTSSSELQCYICPCVLKGIQANAVCYKKKSCERFVCLFDLILYVPSTIFQLYRDGSSWVEPVLS